MKHRVLAALIVVMSALTMTATTASALCSKYAMGDCVPHTNPPPTSPTSSIGTPVSHQSDLPFTGGDVIGLSLVGVGALAGGTALLRRRRTV